MVSVRINAADAFFHIFLSDHPEAKIMHNYPRINRALVDQLDMVDAKVALVAIIRCK